MSMRQTHRLWLAMAAALCLVSRVSAQETQPEKPAGPPREGSLSYKDSRLGAGIPPRRWTMFLPRLARSARGPENDPKYNLKYPHRLQVMCLTDAQGSNREENDLRFVIHFLNPEDEPMARWVGNVMTHLYWVARDYLGVGPVDGRPVSVFLSHDGKAGAEEYRGSIFLYAIKESRAPAEWVRELAHEYSHIFLPTIGKYTEPEANANGYLGERLLMKWLLADNGISNVWSAPIDGNAYVANQVVPLRERFLKEGPASASVEKMDADGMNFFIGQILAMEAAHGPAVLKTLFQKFATPRPQNLPLYITSALQEMKPLQLTVSPTAFIPDQSQPAPGTVPGAPARFQKASYWVYLPGGDWRVDVDGTLPTGVTATLTPARPSPDPLRQEPQLKKGPASLSGVVSWEVNISGVNGAWRRLEFVAPAGQVIEIKRMQIARRNEPGFRPGSGAPAGFNAFGAGQ